MSSLFHRVIVSNECFFGDFEARLIDSVKDNLNCLLNTHQDSLRCFPDYGLPEINAAYQEMPRSMHRFFCDLIEVIEKYEPRLTSLKVTQWVHTDDRGMLSVELSGLLMESTILRFSAHFEQQRRAFVQH